METMGIEEIQKILPQKYPFLFIDRIIELDPGKKVVAIKNVTINDGFFEGHFPGKPLMPGVLILEAMAQTALFIYHSAYEKELKRSPDYFLGSLKAAFLHPVTPGDQLKIIAQTVKLLPTGGFVNAAAFVKDKAVANAELIFSVKR